MRPLFFALGLALSCLSAATLAVAGGTVEIGATVKISGQNVRVSGASDRPVEFASVRGLVVDGASFSRPVRMTECHDVTVMNSQFNGNFEDADAVIIVGDGRNTQVYPWDWNQTKTFDVTKLIIGKPNNADPSWRWSSLETNRGKIWYGEKPDKGSRNIRITNCSFSNAKRAGLFVAHTTGLVVENCTSSGTLDYGLGAEWCHQVVFRGNTGSIGTHYGLTDSLIENNTLSYLWLYSEGLPVRNVTVRNNVVERSLYVSQGVFGNWWLPAWFEDVYLTGNTTQNLYLAANNKPGIPPPYIPTIEARRNTVTGTAFLQSVRVVGLNSFTKTNTWTPKGGVKAVIE